MGSLNELEYAARIIERRMAIAKGFRSPPAPGQSMYPEFAYQENRGTFNRYRPQFPARVAALSEPVVEETSTAELEEETEEEDPEELENLRISSYRAPARGNQIRRSGPVQAFATQETSLGPKHCYNCGSSDGHMAKDCKSERRVFCKDCGTLGSTRNNCSKCPPLGERSYCVKCGKTNVVLANCTDCKEN